MTSVRIVLLALLFVAGPSLAYYVIPYELRPNGPGSKEVYTVLVILADHYDHHFGEEDGLSTLLAANHHADPEIFVADYLKIPHAWYLQQFADNPAVYGERAQEIADGIARLQPIKAGRTSAVVITEHHHINNVLFFLRVDPPGEDGLLSSVRSFKDHLKPLPKLDRKFGWRKDIVLEPEAFLEDVHVLEPREPRLEMQYWLDGDWLELKNFAIDEAHSTKFFRQGYRIARRHKMFTRGGSLFPENLRTLGNGDPLPKDAHLRYGVRATNLLLATFTEEMSNYFGKMGFEHFDRINNEATFNEDLFFRIAETDSFQKRLDWLTSRSPVGREDNVLTYDRGLSELLRVVNCDRVHRAAALIPKIAP